MALTLADLQDWNPEAIEDLALAAAARARTSREKAQELPRLGVYESWEGRAGEAAHEAIREHATRLEISAQTAVGVALGAQKVHSEAVAIKAQLTALFEYAEARPTVFINARTNTGTLASTAGMADEDLAALQAKIDDTAGRITTLLGQAETVDAELAGVLKKATGAGPGGSAESPASAAPPALPEDPKALHDTWNALSPEQKDSLYDLDHNVGNRPGMPTDPTDHRGKDWYNKRHLSDSLAEAQASSDRAEALKNAHPDWAAGKNIPEPNHPGAIFDDRVAYEAWQRQYDTAQADAKYLPDLQATDKALKAGPDRKLMLLDATSGKRVHAAIAIGDPDKSTHTSVTTPGLNTTVGGSIDGMSTEADRLRNEALRQLQSVPARAHESVSTIAWIGYDAPLIAGVEGVDAKVAGIGDVSHDALARVGAHDLARLYDGLHASHEGGPADLTAIGHSYGSLTTSLALQEPGEHGISRALFYGSPGIEAATPAQLHLQPGQVFAMETPDDPIQYVYDARAIGQGVPIVGTYINNEFGDFGPNPATNPNFTRLATGPFTTPNGLALQGAHGHSDYPRFPDHGGLRTTNFNIAAVLAGLTPVPQQ